MPRKCCVPGCRGNYSSAEKVSVFKFPKDPTRKSLWLSKIHCADFVPSAESVVCARHFDEQFIVRIDSVTRPDGSVLTVPRDNVKLRDDAYPTVFPNCPSYLSEEPPKKRRKPEERRAKQRDECAFSEFMEKDRITDFSVFSREVKNRADNTCRVPARGSC